MYEGLRNYETEMNVRRTQRKSEKLRRVQRNAEENAYSGITKRRRCCAGAQPEEQSPMGAHGRFRRKE